MICISKKYKKNTPSAFVGKCFHWNEFESIPWNCLLFALGIVHLYSHWYDLQNIFTWKHSCFGKVFFEFEVFSILFPVYPQCYLKYAIKIFLRLRLNCFVVFVLALIFFSPSASSRLSSNANSKTLCYTAGELRKLWVCISTKKQLLLHISSYSAFHENSVGCAKINKFKSKTLLQMKSYPLLPWWKNSSQNYGKMIIRLEAYVTLSVFVIYGLYGFRCRDQDPSFSNQQFATSKEMLLWLLMKGLEFLALDNFDFQDLEVIFVNFFGVFGLSRIGSEKNMGTQGSMLGSW